MLTQGRTLQLPQDQPFSHSKSGHAATLSAVITKVSQNSLDSYPHNRASPFSPAPPYLAIIQAVQVAS